MEPLQATTKELCLSFNAGNSNKIQHIAFWYVKHKNRIIDQKVKYILSRYSKNVVETP